MEVLTGHCPQTPRGALSSLGGYAGTPTMPTRLNCIQSVTRHLAPSQQAALRQDSVRAETTD